jgi:hypothetical protein
MIDVKSCTLFLSYEPKQGYIKYTLIMSWYKNYIMTKHRIELMKAGKRNKIMTRLTCAFTSFLYPSLHGVAIYKWWLIISPSKSFMMQPLHFIRLIHLLQEMATLTFMFDVTRQGLRLNHNKSKNYLLVFQQVCKWKKGCKFKSW